MTTSYVLYSWYFGQPSKLEILVLKRLFPSIETFDKTTISVNIGTVVLISMFTTIFGLTFFIKAVAMFISRWTTEIAVTNRRMIYKKGWIARSTEELGLARIEEVNLKQSVLGRILGYGTLRIGGVGIGAVKLPPYIKAPLTFKMAIEAAKAETAGQGA